MAPYLLLGQFAFQVKDLTFNGPPMDLPTRGNHANRAILLFMPFQVAQ
jgi:hypothetical protein